MINELFNLIVRIMDTVQSKKDDVQNTDSTNTTSTPAVSSGIIAEFAELLGDDTYSLGE